jgi:hemerythrin-like domain-containing protein
MDANTMRSDARAAAQASCMEHQILDHVKQALRVTLQWKAPAFGVSRKISSIQFTTKSFMRHLERMMALEEEEGYMAGVRQVKPHLEPSVSRLEREHDEFRELIEDLRPEVEVLNVLPADRAQVVCHRLVDLLNRVDQHDVQEIELLQQALVCDEGGEG